jgi:tetratricopeptide (TPR) repeat protein
MSSATSLSALFSELKRRRVIRVTVFYAVVAWAVVEVVETTFPYLGLPEWLITGVIVIAALGLPVAVVLAWAFDITPGGVERTEPLQPVSRRIVWAALGVLVLLAGTGVLTGTYIRGVPSSLDANLVVVLPFRVGGAEPTEQYLREGMLDLLSAKLNGAGGPRAVDPRSVLSRWGRAVQSPQDDLDQASALQLAADLGAGRLLLGEVVSARPHLHITASILDVASGRVRGQASVEGMPDSVPALVDRLAGTLLSLEAGEEAHRVDALTSTSLPALRAYLDGQTSKRQGRYPEARGHFELALERDSTFALAALRLDRTASWIGGLGEVRERAIRLAWTFQDRLSPRDRAHLIAVAGPRYPALSPVAEQLAAWERAVEAAPDHPELWEEYADLLFHFGRALGLDDAEERAETAFLRAMDLDPGSPRACTTW